MEPVEGMIAEFRRKDEEEVKEKKLPSVPIVRAQAEKWREALLNAAAAAEAEAEGSSSSFS
jgi:hypothetical protein